MSEDNSNGQDDFFEACDGLEGADGLVGVRASFYRSQDFTPVTDKNKPKAFWIIFNPHYPAPPKVRFATQESAEATAERMALRFGQEFYVMKAVTRYTRPEKAKRKALP